MMRILLASLLAALSVLMPGAAFAGQAAATGATGAETAARGEPATAVAAEAKASAEREDGEAEKPPAERFRVFQPSEEVSADNAVPFPVDI